MSSSACLKSFHLGRYSTVRVFPPPLSIPLLAGDARPQPPCNLLYCGSRASGKALNLIPGRLIRLKTTMDWGCTHVLPPLVSIPSAPSFGTTTIPIPFLPHALSFCKHLLLFVFREDIISGYYNSIYEWKCLKRHYLTQNQNAPANSCRNLTGSFAFT